MRISVCLLCLIAMIGSGCTPDEPTINSFNDEFRLLVADGRGLSTFSMPDGLPINTNVWKYNESSTPYPVRSIHEFRSEIYVLTAEKPWIVVFRASDLKALDTIDVGSGGACVDVAFANATTAYVTSDSTQAVSIVDLTTNTVVSSIPLQSIAAEIAVIGNQLAVALPLRNEVCIIDSRTNTIEATISIPTASPYYVEGDGPAGVFCVVSLGEGHFPTDERTPKTPTMSFVDITRRTVVKTVELTARASEGPQQIVRGLALDVSGYAFNPVQNGLLRTSTFSKNRASAVQFTEYHRVAYDAARAEVFCVAPDGKTVDMFDEFGEALKRSIVLPDSICALVAIAP